MELPKDVLSLVKEYAMPVTRPDWRTLHIMTYKTYLYEFYKAYKKREYVMIYQSERYRRTGRHKNLFSEYNYGRIIYHT